MDEIKVAPPEIKIGDVLKLTKEEKEQMEHLWDECDAANLAFEKTVELCSRTNKKLINKIYLLHPELKSFDLSINRLSGELFIIGEKKFHS